MALPMGAQPEALVPQGQAVAASLMGSDKGYLWG